MVHLVKCPVCLSDRITVYIKTIDQLRSGEEFRLFRCQSCNFVFTQDHPDEKEAGKYYESDDYVAHSDNAKGMYNKLYHFARVIMLGRKRRMVENITSLKSGNLLDVGSGTGYFAGTMKNAGWNITCIEPNKKARDFAAGKFNLNMISMAQVITLPEVSFDCITLWHVLEHLHNPYEYIAALTRLLKPSGTIIVALPNCNSFDSHHYKHNWAAWDTPRHLWHFSPATFKLFSGNAGLELSGIKSLPFDVFYISILSEKNLERSFPLIRGIIKGLIFSVKSFLNREKSSSLMYVLHRASGQ